MAAFNRTRGTYVAEDVRVAHGHWSRLRGTVQFGFRTGQGLWIVPCRDAHAHATVCPIDLVYLDREGVVVDLCRTAQPVKTAPIHIRAASVLELPPGAIDKSKTALGDEVEIVTTMPGEDVA